MPQRLSDLPLTHLVPETAQWNYGNGIDLKTYASYFGTMELAIAFGELFWPDFFEFHDCIFRGSGPNENDHQWFELTRQSLENDLSAVESLRNHLHIWDIFPDDGGNSKPTREQCLYLARLLREMWQAKLMNEYPGRQFQVVVNEEDKEGDFQVTFFQPS